MVSGKQKPGHRRRSVSTLVTTRDGAGSVSKSARCSTRHGPLSDHDRKLLHVVSLRRDGLISALDGLSLPSRIPLERPCSSPPHGLRPDLEILLPLDDVGSSPGDATLADSDGLGERAGCDLPIDRRDVQTDHLLHGVPVGSCRSYARPRLEWTSTPAGALVVRMRVPSGPFSSVVPSPLPRANQRARSSGSRPRQSEGRGGHLVWFAAVVA